MPNRTLFDYLDYRAYVKELLASKPGKGRGIRSELARVMRCQRSYVSHVLSGKTDFSLEQAEAVSRFLGHDDHEMEYFLALVLFSRAGTCSLKEFHRRKIRRLVNARLKYDKRIRNEDDLADYSRARFYSEWYYGVLCLAVGLPELHTPEALSARLGLSMPRVGSALRFLEECGLIERRQGVYRPKKSIHMHLGEYSRLLPRFHASWRARVSSGLEVECSSELHHSGAMSLSRSDLHRIHAMLVQCIEEVQKTTESSPDETLAAFCVDLFEL